ncbi:hypothetical protein [Falsiroseomonas sp. HW251]|uniref:hypothetical protein n=1 Tax=Falsiroseomonas sp. HW251 TaxID=3390998 RepID=UPI003D31F182
MTEGKPVAPAVVPKTVTASSPIRSVSPGHTFGAGEAGGDELLRAGITAGSARPYTARERLLRHLLETGCDPRLLRVLQDDRERRRRDRASAR